ncbi:MAG: T9SS type A sorting domain-containing protein [Bacteroidia bacterium]|jgi:hypothetical protein|nr:T9SS type A sorting domain-containing protein [Bacteroidia bacterium]
MKKQLLTITSMLLFTVGAFAQFNAAQIWNLNRYVDPMPHNAINIAGITMGGIIYNQAGVPTAGLTTNPAPFPKFRITSTVTGNKLVCISAEQEDNDPWEEKERATFESDGTNDTTVTVEESNNGSAFTNTAKVVIERGSNPNQYTILQYRFRNNDTWVLDSKLFHYLTNGRIDSLVSYRYTGTDSTKNAVRTFYYSNGLDSVLDNSLNVISGQFVVNGRFLVLQKENGKTKQWALESRQTETEPFQRGGTILYSNGPASSLSEVTKGNQFSIYPNPSTSTIKLNFTENASVQNIVILNSNGQKLIEQKEATGIDVSELSAGLYFVQVTTNKGVSTQKFIKN